MQQPEVMWDYTQMIREPSLAVKLYVLFVFGSSLVAAVKLIRSWIILPPFRRAAPESLVDILSAFDRPALSLRRWMNLNALAWGLVTCYGLLTALQGLSSQRLTGPSLLAWLAFDLLQPLPLFLWAVTILFLLRWHLLWRAERISALGIARPSSTRRLG